MSKDKSTNVRTSIRALRLGLHALGQVAPQVAADAAARLFFKTPRRPKRPSPFTEQHDARRIDLRAAGERVAAWTWGEGPTILLVHGWGGRAAQMRSFVGPAVRAGFRVVAFDAPGHGSSSGKELSMPRFAEAVESVGSVFGPIAGIVAHSFGGAASALAMARGLEVGRAVFLGPPASPVTWFEAFARFLELEGTSVHAARASVEARAGIRLEALTAEVLGPKVVTPLLVVHDRRDAEVSWEDGARLARSVAGAKLVTTEGLGHRRILRDAKVVDLTIRFLLEERPDVDALTRTLVCSHCSAPLGEDAAAGPCAACALQIELADRARRWTLAAAHP